MILDLSVNLRRSRPRHDFAKFMIFQQIAAIASIQPQVQ
jgi:hypothetical protein